MNLQRLWNPCTGPTEVQARADAAAESGTSIQSPIPDEKATSNDHQLAVTQLFYKPNFGKCHLRERL